MKNCIRIVWGLFFLMIISAASASTGNAITVRDLTGRAVTLSGKPERIICICPGSLRLAVYLQVQDRVVGMEDMEKRFPQTRPYYIANPQFSDLPSIGPGGPNSINKEPDYEKILSVKPDVIFVSYMEAGLADRVQQTVGIPVFVISYGPFGTFSDKIFESMLAMGRILDKKERAAAVVDYIQGVKRDLLERVRNIAEERKPGVYVGGIGFRGSQGIESTETLYAPFEWVAAKNVAGKTGRTGHLFVDREKLLQLNPDIIFIDGGGKQLIMQDMQKRPQFYKGLKAFSGKRVYTLHSFNWYMTNVGTVITDAYAVGKLLYPERFRDIDLPEQADRVYRFLVGKPVYAEMVKLHGPLTRVLPVLQQN